MKVGGKELESEDGRKELRKEGDLFYCRARYVQLARLRRKNSCSSEFSFVKVFFIIIRNSKGDIFSFQVR